MIKKEPYFKELDEKICDESGLYLIGATTFNPATFQHYYLLKVGMSNSGVKKRLKDYSTTLPMMWIIDTKKNNCPVLNEAQYHKLLKKFSEKEPQLENIMFSHNAEWFCVPAEVYAIICKYGFKALEIYEKFNFDSYKFWFHYMESITDGI